MEDSTLATETLVPANRLGQLLVEARLREGTDLEELASNSPFTVGELGDFEAGHRVLTDELIQQVTDLYALDCGQIVPQRDGLVIDLDEGRLSAAYHAYPLESTDRDHVLERYLSLVYLLRDNPPGNKLVLRDEDLDILAASLAERRELIDEQLDRAMSPANQSLVGLVQRLKKRLWVPAAGALVGATSIGALVIVTSAPTGEIVTTEDLLNDPSIDPNVRNDVAQIIAASQAPTATQDNTASEVPSIPETSTAPEPSLATSASSTAEDTASPDQDTTQSDTTQSPTNETSGQLATASGIEREANPIIVPEPFASSTSTSTTTSTTSTTAEPATTRPASQARSANDLSAQAEALLPFNWQQVIPGWQITYRGHNNSFRGLTFPHDQAIEIFIRSDDTPQSIAAILAHEIGHAIDVTYLDSSDRDEWLRVRGIEDAPWWADAYASDFQSGAGDFAEAFATWSVGDPSASQIAGQPTREQLNTMRSFLNDVL